MTSGLGRVGPVRIVAGVRAGPLEVLRRALSARLPPETRPRHRQQVAVTGPRAGPGLGPEVGRHQLVCLLQTLDLQRVRGVEDGWQLVGGDIDVAEIHEFDNSLKIIKCYIFENYNRVLKQYLSLQRLSGTTQFFHLTRIGSKDGLEIL